MPLEQPEVSHAALEWLREAFFGLCVALASTMGAIAWWVSSQIEKLHGRVSAVDDEVVKHSVRLAVAESGLKRLERIEEKLDRLLQRHGLPCSDGEGP